LLPKEVKELKEYIEEYHSIREGDGRNWKNQKKKIETAIECKQIYDFFNKSIHFFGN
jgi:hypothetical protein